MNIYYVVASYKRSPEPARFAVTAETPEQATAEVMDEHCGRNLWGPCVHHLHRPQVRP
jgi:hypothetical protein